MIERFVDFEVLEAQFEKYKIIQDFLGVMHDMKHALMSRREKMVYIWQLLESLDEVENGFRIFYKCLRETQYPYNNHDTVLHFLEGAGKSEL